MLKPATRIETPVRIWRSQREERMLPEKRIRRLVKGEMGAGEGAVVVHR